MKKQKLISVEEELWQKVKALANLKKMTISQIIEYLLSKDIKEELANAI